MSRIKINNIITKTLGEVIDCRDVPLDNKTPIFKERVIWRMYDLALFCLILMVVSVALCFVWNVFFNWYEQKRLREAQCFLSSINILGTGAQKRDPN